MVKHPVLPTQDLPCITYVPLPLRRNDSKYSACKQCCYYIGIPTNKKIKIHRVPLQEEYVKRMSTFTVLNKEEKSITCQNIVPRRIGFFLLC